MPAHRSLRKRGTMTREMQRLTCYLSRSTTLLVCLVGLSIFTPMQALGQFQHLGGIIVGNPSCANAGGEVTCAVKGPDNSLFGIRFDPGTHFTTGFQSLGGIVVGNPSCASTSDSNTSPCVFTIRIRRIYCI
jgi:hypothetical protein